jgi:H+/gluconate symporter-like permease
LPFTCSFIVGTVDIFVELNILEVQRLTFALFYFLCSSMTTFYLTIMVSICITTAFYRPQHLGIAAEGPYSTVGTDIILGKKSVQKHQHKTTLSKQLTSFYPL